MEKMKKARRPLRSQMTRIVSELETLMAAANLDRDSIRAKMNFLEAVVEKIQVADQQIIEELQKADATEEELDKEYQGNEEYQSKYYYVKARGERSMISRPPSSSAQSDSGSRSDENKRTVKLPKIELKKFSGEIRDWLSFWAQFSKIHEDRDLHSSDKFEYLVQAMVQGSRACDLVLSYPRTDGNYEKAVRALKERFGRDDLLVEVYVRELLTLVVKNVGESKVSSTLSKLYDQLESHLRSLETLGITSDKYEAILFPMVESCLAIPILRAWQRSSLFRSDNSKGRLSLLMEFLKREVEGDERITLASAGFDGRTNNRQKVGANNPKLIDHHVARNERKERRYVTPPTATSLHNGEKRRRCAFCEKTNHESRDCFQAPKMTVKEKRGKLTKANLCTQCFLPHSKQSECKMPVRCCVCGGKHHAVICPDLPSHNPRSHVTEPDVDTNSSHQENTVTTGCSHTSQDDVILQTAIVTLTNGKREKKVRALFDTGSQRSHILKKTAIELGYQKVGSETITHVLFGGIETKKTTHGRYKIQLKRPGKAYSFQMEVLDQDAICGEISNATAGPWLRELKENKIWVEDIRRPNLPIELLIGADVYCDLHTGKVHPMKCGLTAVETRLGWTLMGKQARSQTGEGVSMTVTSMLVTESSVSDLWRLETIGIRDPVEVQTIEERHRLVMDHFRETVTRGEDGRYHVNLPWRHGPISIPANRDVALRRLEKTTKSLKMTHMYDAYNAVFSEWLKEGIIAEVSEAELATEKCHYLPHRAVIKQESVTTKVRPVFDASCKSGRAPSLNDCLEVGPNLIDLIPAIFHRFRKHAFGVISDIRKAFLMIGIKEEDQDFLRFLWWTSRKCTDVKAYKHKRVVFGVNCSPFLLSAVIGLHLDKYGGEKGEVARKLRQSLYVDNCVASLPNRRAVSDFIRSSTEIMTEAKMDLRLWQDNCHVSNEMKERVVPVMGMRWDRYEDTLFCEMKTPLSELPTCTTKRTILSLTQQIFDPLGILSPVTLRTKLMLQEAWAQKKAWDEPVDEDTESRFMKWMKELPVLASIKVPRYFTRGNHDERNWSLHTFCDASGMAFAAATFIRCEGEKVTVQLLQAKARVAPLKKMTIPRLELLACTIGVRLCSSVTEALQLENAPKYYWTDSSTVLAWIRRNDDWGTFVGNRIREILRLTKVSEWNHVPGKQNPADLPSRGCSAEQLSKSRWWEGPSWLLDDRDDWPMTTGSPDEDEVNTERRRTTTSNVVVEKVEKRPFYMNRVSGYTKILRTMALVFRFIANARNTDKQTGNLTSDEVQRAERKLVHLIQGTDFPKGRVMEGLDTYRDEEGVIRVRTKIVFRRDTEYFRAPMLLPSKHPFVEELIRENHLKYSHAGAQHLIAKIREKYWIIHTRKAVNSVIHKCVRCRRYSSKKLEVQTAPLPEDRIRDAAVFEIIGVDLAGPLYLKHKQKAWIVLYTCAVYRAIHLELVLSLNTESFLQSFRRFIARRGRPRIVYSDNGTNFKGSVNLFRSLDWEAICRKFLTDPIVWRFNCAYASWWGGFFERLVRSVKSLLVRVLGKSTLTYEELMTVLCDVEATINHRPLTYVTEDGSDLIPLTPAMFIQGVERAGVPDLDQIDREGFKRRFRYRNKVLEELRGRFRTEYLGVLLQKSKDSKRDAVRVGAVVFVAQDNKRRLEWPMARVMELYVSKDGHSRTARLKTVSGELVRPVQRLFPTEVEGDDVIVQGNDESAPNYSKRGRRLKKPVRFSSD